MLDFAHKEWAFETETKPVYDATGEEISGYSYISRPDTGVILGVHKGRYKKVDHDSVVDSMLESITKANVSKDYDLKVEVIEEGRKLRGELLFNDLVVEPKVGDYAKFKYEFFNSYDGSWALQTRASALCLWCLNGATTPHDVGSSQYKHTQRLSIDAVAAQSELAVEHFFHRKETWQQYLKTKIEPAQVENLFRKTIVKMPSKQQEAPVNKKQLENLLNQYSTEASNYGHNMWALYNCMTYWATHTDQLKNPAVARYNRETQIKSAMNSKQWRELENS